MGVLLGVLRGNETKKLVSLVLGKTIEKAEVVDDTLRITFSDGITLSIWDDGQSCCESRWMSTDDDLDQFAGTRFTGAEVRDGGYDGSVFEVRESQFLIVHTSLGEFTVVNYNEHNGYYGGFRLAAKIEKE